MNATDTHPQAGRRNDALTLLGIASAVALLHLATTIATASIAMNSNF
jgi:hypothetical protein